MILSWIQKNSKSFGGENLLAIVYAFKFVKNKQNSALLNGAWKFLKKKVFWREKSLRF